MKDYFQSDTRYLKLDIPFPYEEMLEEAKALHHRFVSHRAGESNGWASLTLHGLGEDKHENWDVYGYDSGEAAGKDMFWTTASDDCPKTTDFFKNSFPSKRFGRIRFMLLRAGGYIGLHSDSRLPLVENINMVLNNPIECKWKWGDGEVFDMLPGNAYAMNLHYHHSVYNESNEDRYHIIVARHDSLSEWRTLVDKAAIEQNVTGHYIQLSDLP